MNSRREELEIEVRNLYRALDDRDYVISQLERKLKTGQDLHSEKQNQNEHLIELEDTKRELNNCRHTIAELRYIVDQYSAENEVLKEDRKQLEEQIYSHQDVLEVQKKKLFAATQRSDDVKKKQRDETNDLYRLELENERLTSEVQELEENEKDLVLELENIARERHSVELQYHSKCQENETLKVTFIEHSRQHDALQSEIDVFKKKLEAEQKKSKDYTVKMTNLKEQYTMDIENIMDELRREKDKNKVLDDKAALAIAAKRENDANEEINDLNLELQAMHIKVEKLEYEKQRLESEYEHVNRSLVESLHEIASLKQDIEAQEYSINKSLKLKLDDSINKEKMSKVLCTELAEQLAKVRNELRLSEERNSWYEEKYNLCDAVKYQRKLEADIRRRDADLKSKTILLGEKNDQINLLKKMCETMKEALGPEFQLDAADLKEAIAIDENLLKSQISELVKQVEELERDRVSLMKRLRENAAQISEKGMRFVGLKAEQIIQLTEFARNLKDGKVELPLNDRSLQLSSKLAELKALRQSDLINIERLERELENLRTSNNEVDSNIDSELSIMRNMLQEIQSQNKVLRSRIEKLNKFNDIDASCEDINQTLSPLERRRIERVLGEPLESVPKRVIGQFQCFLKEYEKIESELSIMKASMLRWSRNKQLQSSESRISKTFISSHTKPHLLEKVDERIVAENGSCTGKYSVFAKRCVAIETEPIIRNDFQVQVCLTKRLSAEQSTNDERGPNRRDEEILEKLKVAEDQLQVNRDKVKRLKEALRHSLTSNRCENRIMMAQASVNQLKSIITEKNKVIQKYRNRFINQSGFNYDDDKAFCADWTQRLPSTHFVELETNSTLSHTAEDLIKKLKEASALILEQEKVIKALQSDITLCYESNDQLSVRERELLKEVARLKDIEDSLHSQLHQAEVSTDKIGIDQVGKINVLEMEKTNLEGVINVLKIESGQKDDRIERMRSYIIDMKRSLKELDENARRVPVLESEIKQLKANMHVCGRTRDRWERAVSALKRKQADLIDELEKSESQNIKLRKDVMDAKQMKVSALNKSKRIAQKLKESQDTVLRDQEILNENKSGRHIEMYKKKIQSLKKDNVKLRGIVASYTIKAETLKSGPVDKRNSHQDSKLGLHKSKHFKQTTFSVDNCSQTDFYNEAKKSRFVLFEFAKQGQHQSEIESQYLPVLNSERKEQDVEEENEKYDAQNLSVMNNSIYSFQLNKLNHQNGQNLKIIDKLRHELQNEQTINKELQIQLTTMQQKFHQVNEQLEHNYECSKQVDTLRQEMCHLKRKLSAANADRSLSGNTLNTKAAELKLENDRLRKELSSFTLEFFEEIEDLKYNYEEAKKHLASYGDHDIGGEIIEKL